MSIGFFKGSLLKDANGILVKPGENSQAMRFIKFTDVQEIVNIESSLKSYINEAIEIEKAGLDVNFKKISDITIPQELQDELDKDNSLKTAFNSLSPGRQRGYILYFSQAKQSSTRKSRIEKHIPQILQGKGLND
ncbi:MAG: YdeI/OmpD-associated family protein [Dysgonomonas sp.]